MYKRQGYYWADGTTRRNTGTTGTQSNNGLTTKNITFEDGTPAKAYLRQDGTLARAESYHPNGALDGVWLYYKDGRTISRFTAYWNNGNVKGDGYYRQDGTTRSLELYNSNGIIRSSTDYRTDGTREQIFFYSNGELDFRTCYDLSLIHISEPTRLRRSRMPSSA